MQRTIAQWNGMVPVIVAAGSEAQCMYCMIDARLDILELSAFVRRVASLNRDAGEIGAGMLASLVDDARRLLA